MSSCNLLHDPMRKHNRQDSSAPRLPWGPGKAVSHGLCSLLATTRPRKSLPEMLHMDIGESLFSLDPAGGLVSHRSSLLLSAEALRLTLTHRGHRAKSRGGRALTSREHPGPGTSSSNTKFPCGPELIWFGFLPPKA